MSKCHLCNVEILDETDRCPLCQSVLEKTYDVENMYPDIRIKSRKWLTFSRFYLFIMVAIDIILLNVALFCEHSSVVFFIPALVLLYGYTVIRYAIVGKSNYRAKFLVLTVVAILMLLGIDYFAGYHGWAVNYALPSGIIFMDLTILMLMLINRRNWQSYMMLQILMIICSMIPFVLYLLDIITEPVVSVVAFNLSLIIFLGTLIIGDRRARTELKRKFHI